MKSFPLFIQKADSSKKLLLRLPLVTVVAIGKELRETTINPAYW